jgi:hypothetical protein
MKSLQLKPAASAKTLAEPQLRCVDLHVATFLDTRQRVRSTASERVANTLATPIIRSNENTGQSASSALVHHSTSQR